MFPKLCSCGLVYDREAWAKLPLVGHWIDEHEKLELRNCSCMSTISIPVRRSEDEIRATEFLACHLGDRPSRWPVGMLEALTAQFQATRDLERAVCGQKTLAALERAANDQEVLILLIGGGR